MHEERRRQKQRVREVLVLCVGEPGRGSQQVGAVGHFRMHLQMAGCRKAAGPKAAVPDCWPLSKKASVPASQQRSLCIRPSQEFAPNPASCCRPTLLRLASSLSRNTRPGTLHNRRPRCWQAWPCGLTQCAGSCTSLAAAKPRRNTHQTPASAMANACGTLATPIIFWSTLGQSPLLTSSRMDHPLPTNSSRGQPWSSPSQTPVEFER